MNDIKTLQHLFNVEGFTDSNGNKLVEDGIVGPRTLQAAAKCTVAYNARGPITKWIQARLIGKGYSVGATGADGIFGKNTYAAVESFQAKNKLKVDGIVGINTWTVLLK